MAKGAIAKENVIRKLQAAFGADFIGEFDKKVYVWAQENGEYMQIAISLTCPKIQVGVDVADMKNEINFDEAVAAATPVKTEPAVITQDEKDTVAALMARLGL